MKKPKLYLRRPILITFLISGFFGALLGFLYAQYQWAVEPAQVLAGLVQYPSSNPFYIVTSKSWSFLHQILALFLSMGISERMLSFLLSSLTGMISFQALTLFSFALTNSLLLSFFIPFFIFYLHGTAFPGLNYPIMILGTDLTYGMLALSFFIMVISFWSLKKYKIGGVLLGLAPAIHAIQGSWCNFVLLFIFLSNWNNFKKILKKNCPFLLLGYSISLISLLYHFLNIYDIPKLSSQVLSPYYQAIILYWSDHYQKFPLFTGNTLRITAALILSLWGLRFFKKKSSPSFLFQTFIIVFLPATILSFIYWLPLEKASLYYNLLILFPARLFNYHILGSLLLLIGLLWRFKKDFLNQLNLFLLLLSLLIFKFLYPGLAQFFESMPHFNGFMGLLIFLSSLFFIFYMEIKRRFLLKTKKFPIKKNLFNTLSKMIYLLLTLTSMLTFIGGFRSWITNQNNYFQDSTNNSFFQKVSQRKGMIIPGPQINYLMLKTRRPVLFNGGPGILNYAPEGSLEMERILRQVYGIDFFNPPAAIVKYGRDLPPFKVKPLWEKRTLNQWQEIKEEFGTADIVTESGWQLQLPVIIQSESYILYTIPD